MPTLLHGPGLSWGSGRGVPPSCAHYWADLQLVHGYRCYDNIAPHIMVTGARDIIQWWMQNVSKYLLVLALRLVKLSQTGLYMERLSENCCGKTFHRSSKMTRNTKRLTMARTSTIQRKPTGPSGRLDTVCSSGEVVAGQPWSNDKTPWCVASLHSLILCPVLCFSLHARGSISRHIHKQGSSSLRQHVT